MDESVLWHVFHVEDLLEFRERIGYGYLAFLERPALSGGISRSRLGAPRRGVPQQPRLGAAAYEVDEVHYVVEGRAQAEVGGESRPVRAGSIVYVRAGVPHRFHSVEEPLTMLIFFSAAQLQLP